MSNSRLIRFLFYQGVCPGGQMDTNEEKIRGGVLVSIYPQGGERECLTSLDELSRLLDTAGAETVGVVTQLKALPDGKTCVGSGKVDEIKQLVETTGAELVIFDTELTPVQIRELEDRIGDVDVLDRSMLILDIFAKHAQSAEGRLQVELAQLRYTAPRLSGKGRDMSRLGGGIGTRGPGESKLEIDRRRIKERIRLLEDELAKVEKNRMTMRIARDKSGLKKCAIVGYTNAGKSTLLNCLTDAGILAENKLFATLDPTTRQFELPSGQTVLLTDTVGFIKRLPHHLIKAFKSTLDEAVYADMIMIVCDASDPEFVEQLKCTSELLTELGASGKPTLYVFNKCDACADRDMLTAMKRISSENGGESVFISAKTGADIDALVAKMQEIAGYGKKRVKFRFPHSDGSQISVLYKNGDDVVVDYRDDATYAEATCDEKLSGQLEKYIIE